MLSTSRSVCVPRWGWGQARLCGGSSGSIEGLGFRWYRSILCCVPRGVRASWGTPGARRPQPRRGHLSQYVSEHRGAVRQRDPYFPAEHQTPPSRRPQSVQSSPPPYPATCVFRTRSLSGHNRPSKSHNEVRTMVRTVWSRTALPSAPGVLPSQGWKLYHASVCDTRWRCAEISDPVDGAWVQSAHLKFWTGGRSTVVENNVRKMEESICIVYFNLEHSKTFQRAYLTVSPRALCPKTQAWLGPGFLLFPTHTFL